MLATLLTGLFLALQALGQLSSRLSREEPPPYLVHQPLPWQLQCVTRGRRASRDSAKGGGSRHNSLCSVSGRKGDATTTPSSESTELGDPAGKVAVTIQTHSCKHHQHQQ